MTTTPPLLEIVQTIYAAFGRGDVPTIIAQVADDVDWRINVDPKAPGANRVPDFPPVRGKAGVQQFFSAVGQGLEFHSFEPRSFLTGGQEVVVHVLMDMTVRTTGRRLKIECMHHFTFDQKGRVVRFVEYMDTLGVAAAWDAVQAKG